MHKRISALALAMMAVASVLGVTGCGGGGGTVQVTELTFTPATANVPAGEISSFSLMVTFSNPTNASGTTPVITYLVNGVAGGTAATGTIVPSTNDALVGQYTAPVDLSGAGGNTVTITATTPQTPGSTTDTAIITSNSVVVTLTAGEGLSVNPTTALVPAGSTFQFGAIFDNQNVTTVAWSVTPVAGENVGSISSAGLYTAPPFPPPGGTVTISAVQGTVTATAVATIAYSDASLSGPFSFSYSGNDKTGFIAAAGSFQADGAGHIVTGVQDQTSFTSGAATAVPISGTYTVTPDGRGTISLNSGSGQGTINTLQFVLSTNQHGLLTRFDAGFTGSGTLDQQNVDALSGSASVVSGNYVFRVAGADTAFHPLGIAGRFTSPGTGTIPNSGAVLDVRSRSGIARRSVTRSVRCWTSTTTGRSRRRTPRWLGPMRSIPPFRAADAER